MSGTTVITLEKRIIIKKITYLYIGKYHFIRKKKKNEISLSIFFYIYLYILIMSINI